MADDREELHELREGGTGGIEGSSKMTANQLREALTKWARASLRRTPRTKRRATTVLVG